MKVRLIILGLVIALLLLGSIGSGNKTVTTAGTRVALSAATQPVLWVTVQAKIANTGKIYVGDVTVSSANGVELASGDSMHFGLAMDGRSYYNLTEIYIDSSVSGEGVKFTYAKRP